MTRKVKTRFGAAVRDRLTDKQRKLYARAVTVCLDRDRHGKPEAPQIGCGIRRVVVDVITGSRVRLIYPANGEVAILKRWQWDDIVRCAKKRGLME